MFKVEQYFDEANKKWDNIPTLISKDPEQLAYAYCKQHSLHTRVIKIKMGDDGEEISEVLREYKIQMKR